MKGLIISGESGVVIISCQTCKRKDCPVDCLVKVFGEEDKGG